MKKNKNISKPGVGRPASAGRYIEPYMAGVSPEVIAAKYGIKASTVRIALKKAGVYVPRKRHYKMNIAPTSRAFEVLAQMLKGKGYTEAAQICQCSKQYACQVWDRARAAGIVQAESPAHMTFLNQNQ